MHEGLLFPGFYEYLFGKEHKKMTKIRTDNEQ